METLTANALKASTSAPEATKKQTMKSPNDWYIVVKSKSGNCVFFSFADYLKSSSNLEDCELAAFPTLKAAW